MKIAIRADASSQIGSGHVMRCLTLAEELRARDNEVIFISRELPGHSCDTIQKNKFKIFRLPFKKGAVSVRASLYQRWLGVSMSDEIADTGHVVKSFKGTLDWLLVDSYSLGLEWERTYRPAVKRILVVDDLAARKHDCDVLLDQNLSVNDGRRYKGLVPDSCVKLLGPRYALLRQEFKKYRKSLPERSGVVKHVNIFFGGADSTGETEKALVAIESLADLPLTYDVIVGNANVKKDRIKKRCEKNKKIQFHLSTPRMAELFLKSDLALGACGTTTWERCALGVPSVTIAVADNQIPIARGIVEAGVTAYLGVHDNVTSEHIAKEIRRLYDRPADVKRMAEHAYKMVDAEGAGRVADAMLNL